jgi:DNA-binding response OmpR family regulator
MAAPVSLVRPVSPHQAFVQAGIAPRATTGAEGIRKALEHSPDVALVDIDLGGESGFDVVRRLHDGRVGSPRS